ncbi:LysR family transcriptional regulator [Rhodobacteraceae bacterium B1Z28]|uniref:LysR family transcriptional regulator n=1 Tax=Ruegeria haliotis TaxID=2747601 RepID=A0ABX2PXC2_9RHOB|nr:LysR substrate-binding domain-containing protein [Ruegeria haliotis]NVO58306.1 LysR family transcriptional regulator [Ruegeria haliotis]
MAKKSLSLKWLEIFQLISKLGSVQKVSAETGLSISTVSNHLRSLENALDVDLVDHSRRPMGLTPAGTVFARHVREGLTALRRGEAELRSGSWQHATDLRLALIDDFDNQIAPELFRFLSATLPRCSFRHFTRPSHEIIEKLQAQKLDAGVATRPTGNTEGLVEFPLLRDPFIIVLPPAFNGDVQDLSSAESQLPFLRYSRDYTIGKLIETQLTRSKINLPNRFELECNQAIMGLVAEGSGWTITTAASYYRARRFHEMTRALPLPGKSFARTVSLFTSNVYPTTTSRLIHQTLQNLIDQHFVEPMTTRFPWLGTEFRSLPSKSA